MRKVTVVWFLQVLLIGALSGQNLLKPVSLDSPVYDWLAQLYTLQGRALPSHSAPFTSQQILSMLAEVADGGPLEASIRASLALPVGPGGQVGLALRATSSLRAEFYASLDSPSSPETGYFQRAPFLQTVFEGWLFDSTYAAFDLQVKKDPFAVADESNAVSNAPTQVAELDFLWPYWAGIVWGGEHWDVRFFRSKASFATSRWNLALSADAGEVDQLSLSTWWDQFQYTFLWIPVDNTAIGAYPDKGYPSTAENDATGDSGYKQAKTFLAHRLQFRPVPQLSITLTELTIFQSQVFDPRYLNPLLPSHNWFLSANSNPDISLEVEYAPLPGWSLWGQAYGDYIKTAFKDTLYQDPTPGSLAWLAGTRIAGRWLGLPWALEVEGVYSDPFLYLNNHINMIKTTRFLSNYRPGRYMIDTPFGFELGPDTVAERSRLTWESPQEWKFEVAVPFQIRGENTIRTMNPLQPSSFTSPSVSNPLYGHPEIYLPWVTPTGTPETRLAVQVLGELGPRLWRAWGIPWDASMSLQSGLTWIWNKDHVVTPVETQWKSSLTVSSTW